METHIHLLCCRRVYNQPSLSGWSLSGWHTWPGPLSSRFLHNKSVVILNKGGKGEKVGCSYIWYNSYHWNQERTDSLPHFQCLGQTLCECLLTEYSEPERETEWSRWGNRTGTELSAWVGRTVTFTCISNLGWRLNGTPSRAAERWVNDDCAANTCREKRQKDRDRNCWHTINSRDAAISRFVTAVFIREVVSPVAEFIRWYWRRRRVAAEKTPTQRVKLCTWSFFNTIPQ